MPRTPNKRYRSYKKRYRNLWDYNYRKSHKIAIKNYHKVYRATNKNKIKRYMRKWRVATINNFKSVMAIVGCMYCGLKDVRVLQWAHTEPRNGDLSRLVSNLINIGAYNKIFEEIKRCVLLCANCHLIYDSNKHKEAK